MKDVSTFAAAPLPADFVRRATDNQALFPRGVDWLLVGRGRILGLPRSARLSRLQAEEVA